MREHKHTLTSALERSAARGEGELVFHLDDGRCAIAIPELAEWARGGAATLAALGVRPSDRVGILGLNRPEWVRWAFAVWAAGAVLVPLPFPLRVRDGAALSEQLRSLVEAAGCRIVLHDEPFRGLLPESVGIDWNQPAPRRGGPAAAVRPGDPAVIQFTSGSTARPKGALLTHAAVLGAIGMVTDFYWLKASQNPVMLTWLPFFHDLGLFSYLVRPVVNGTPAHILPTERFARDPAIWFRLIGSEGVTQTSGPSSGWSAAVRAAAREPRDIDLSSLRAGVLAAEVVEPDVVDALIEVGGRFGLRPEAVSSAYGLAEMTLGVCARALGRGMRFDTIDPEELTAAGRATPRAGEGSKRITSSGAPFPGVRIRVCGAGDADLPERHVGEILVQGPSMMRSYVGPGAIDPFVDGWLRTGDLGYVAHGELYITGRAKDVVIVMGRNYYPEDFEWAAGRVPGVRRGRCVAFARPGREELILLVEPASGADTSRLASNVRNAVLNAIGLAPSEVLVVAPGTVEKTTSGKLRRGAMRDAYARGDLASTAGVS